MVLCCVPKCPMRSDRKTNVDECGNKITFHEFPSKAELRNQWIFALKSHAPELSNKDMNVRKSVICSLHFQDSDFKTGLKLRRLFRHVVPSVFPDPYTSKQKARIKSLENRETVMNTNGKNVVIENIAKSEHLTENSIKIENEDDSKTMGAVKNNIVPIKKDFSYKKLVLNLSCVEKPNQFWGVTPTEKFIIFSRWNEKYVPEKRIVIKTNLSIKVFFGELEINVMDLMKLTSTEDVSLLLEKVENIKLLTQK